MILGTLTMIEAGNVLGVLAAALLLMAVIAWVKLIRGPLTQRMDGRTGMDPAEGEFASELLFWAAGLSSAAMFLAVAGWIFR
jgi:hypothetical protein